MPIFGPNDQKSMFWTKFAIDSDCLPKVCYLKLKKNRGISANSDNLSPVKPLHLPGIFYAIMFELQGVFFNCSSPTNNQVPDYKNPTKKSVRISKESGTVRAEQ